MPSTSDPPAEPAPLDRPLRAATAPTTDSLDALVVDCRACPRLVAWREQAARERRASFAAEEYWGRPLPGFGDPHAGVVLVGLAPAAHGGNRTGRMFTGDRSGDFLVAALHRTGFANQGTSTGRGDGLVLTDLRMSAPVRCAPPENRPTPTERATCSPYLARELELVGPRVVVALGAFGWAATLDVLAAAGWALPRPRPRFGHGAEVLLARDDRSIVLLGCYHPSPHNTFTGRLTPDDLDAVLLRARELAG